MTNDNHRPVLMIVDDKLFIFNLFVNKHFGHVHLRLVPEFDLHYFNTICCFDNNYDGDDDDDDDEDDDEDDDDGDDDDVSLT